MIEVPPDVLDLLASGRSDAAALKLLRDGQVNKHLLLLRDVLNKAPDRRAFDLLSEVQRRAPTVFRDTIADPHFGTWAARTLRATDPAGYTHLGAIAASAALRAGLDFHIELPAPSGAVLLPGLGLVRTTHNRVVLGPATEISVPVRVLSAGHDVRLDDLNPYRDLPRLRVTNRLDERAAGRWQSLYESAWAALPRHRVHEITACVHTLVPLLRTNFSHDVSATSRDAFGAVALTTPRNGTTFAETLVHECQHGILNALHHLVELYDPADNAWYYSPWRLDPRPVRGLLRGVHAFLAVADFWRERDEFKFTLTVGQLRRALDTLDHAGLTAHGRRLANGIRSTVDSWEGVDPPPEVLRQLENHWDTWRARYPNLVGRSAR